MERRSESEEDAYMEGQRAALKLAREKGVEHAERIIELSHAGILRNRAESPRTDLREADHD